MHKHFFITAAMMVLVMTGVGCSKTAQPTGEPTATGTNETYSTSSTSVGAVEMARRIQLSANDTFEIEQLLPGSGMLDQRLLKAKTATRLVTVKRFIPFSAADVEWTMMVNADKSSAQSEDTTNRLTLTGSVPFMNLAAAHRLLLSAYWATSTVSALNERSGLWLSDDAFQELKNTRQTLIEPSIQDDPRVSFFNRSPDLKGGLEKLKGQAASASPTRELGLIKTDGQLVDWPLTVNGKQITVAVIKASNWYGEYVILNNRQNPLILQFTADPKLAVMKGVDAWQKYFNYKLDNLLVNGFKAE